MEHKFSFRRALSLIVVLAMVLSTAPVFALTASAEDATIGLDRANHYDWTQKDFQSESYTPTAASAGEVLVAASEDATALVGGRFGGNYFTWWYAILAEFDAEANVFVISEIDLPGDSEGKPYEAWTLGEGRLVILCNTGYASTEPAGNAADAAIIKTLEVGQKLALNGTDLATLQAASGALEGVSVTLVTGETAPEEPKPEEPVVESVNIAPDATYTTSPLFRQNESWSWGDDAPIAYPDEDGVSLVDGVLPAEGAAFGDAEWAGFNSKFPGYEPVGYHWITFDLGESTDLAKFIVHYGTKALSNGITAPTGISVFVSEDGENWGEAIGSAVPENNEASVNESATIEAAATGRYVQFRITSNGWAFISEVEVYNAGSEGGNTDPDEPVEPEENLEDLLKEFVGEANADAKLDLVIDAPESYKAGDEITVTVSVKNITSEIGIHLVKFELYYDFEKLVLTNDLDEEENNCVVCFGEDVLPNGWSNFTKVNNDFNEENEEGTEVKPLNDGVIYASALTEKDTAKAAIKDDDVLVFTFTFKALEDAEGDIGLAIPHATAEGAINNDAGAEIYPANGGYAIIEAFEEEKPVDPDKPVVPGDASNMLVFAIIAVLAMAGSAVVVKTRK